MASAQLAAFRPKHQPVVIGNIPAVSPVIAICEASDPSVLGYLVPVAGAAFLIGIVVLVFRDTPRILWPRLSIVLVGAIVVGGVVVMTPGGLSDPGGDYLARAITAVVIGIGGGLIAASRDRRYAFNFAVVGGIGGAALIAAVLGLLVAFLWGGGNCFG